MKFLRKIGRIAAKAAKEAAFPLLLVALSVLCTLKLLGFDLTKLPQQLSLSRKMNGIYSQIEDDYLFGADLDTLTDAAASGIISALGDDYATYYNPQAYVEKKADLDSQSKGIGIVYSTDPDSGERVVIYVNRECPAQKAGIKQGDLLKTVRGKSVSGLTMDEISELVSSSEGETIKITVERDGKKIDTVVKPADYIADTVRWHKINSTGFIQIIDFNNTTADQFKTAIAELQKQKVDGLIFDLRENGGGTIDSCAEMLDILLPECDTVRIQRKDGSITVTKRSDKNEIKLPMAVLVDNGTASASEIFAMNIRDNKKGAIIGTKTFGKGIIQTTYGLTDGTAIKFTTAYIIDKNGATYHKKGLTPDIEIKLTEEQQRRFWLLGDDDPQIKAAIDYIKQK